MQSLFCQVCVPNLPSLRGDLTCILSDQVSSLDQMTNLGWIIWNTSIPREVYFQKSSETSNKLWLNAQLQTAEIQLKEQSRKISFPIAIG